MLTPLITSRLGLGVLIVAAVVGLAWGLHQAVYQQGVSACRAAAAAANAAAVAQQMDHTLDEIERGNRISAELSQTQRRLDAKQTEYLAYAHAITGVCDPAVRVLVEYASGAQTDLPKAPGAPAAAAAAESPADLAYQAEITRAIGVNIATNYARLDTCLAGYSALIDWHTDEKALK